MTDHNPPKTLIEHLEDVKAIAEIAANRAEIALRSADRAESAALKVVDALSDLKRTTLDTDGRPGLLYWIGNELKEIREQGHPVTRAKMYIECLVLAVVAGGFAGALLTCVSGGRISP
jgi:hypothetical protein